MAKTIRDPIHGDIEVSELELNVLDSPQMQRLRRIKQLSFCSLIYPGANHTRFEHSLGTMHIAGKMASAAGLDEEESKKIRLAALLHDVGHLPYSHSLESVLGLNHEAIGKYLLKKSSLSEIITENYALSEVFGILAGKGPGKIVSSQIDADRIDYLARDSHYTGVAYGVVDIERIINVTRLQKESLCFLEKGITAIESLLVGRNLMFSAVYFHHTVRIAEAMLQNAVGQIKEQLEREDLILMGDDDLRTFIRNHEEGREIFQLLDNRRLYKLAYRWGLMDINKTKDINKIKTELSKKGVDMASSIIQQVCVPHNITSDLSIITDKGIFPMSKISDMVNTLDSGLKKLEGIEIYSPNSVKDSIAKACANI
jgi:uncharacterized protein